MNATAVATIDRAPRSVLHDMSARYGMEPAAFEATLRATVCKGSVSREEFAAFLLVAKEYRLNPLTKEIYAFPAKGGGIQPILSIDGWCRIINEHPALDGIEFDDVMFEGKLEAVTCRIFRKDRSHATSVTEYMSECRRTTDVWKTWPARMLRHKALIQAARYAFGFSGIVDQDEYERQIEQRPPERSGVAARLEGPSADEGFNAVRAAETAVEIIHDAETGEIEEAAPDDDTFPGDRPFDAAAAKPDAMPENFDVLQWADDFEAALPSLTTPQAVTARWSEAKTNGIPAMLQRADLGRFDDLVEKRERRIEALRG